MSTTVIRGPEGLTVGILRELLRNMQAWRSAFEAGHVTEVLTFGGDDYCLWDIESIYHLSQQVLPPRMRQSIRLCLILNMREEDAAREMGISPTNPVAAYASVGLTKLIALLSPEVLSEPEQQPVEAPKPARGTIGPPKASGAPERPFQRQRVRSAF